MYEDYEDYEDYDCEEYYSDEVLEDTIKELDNSALALGGFEQVGNKKIYKPGIQYLGSKEFVCIFIKKCVKNILVFC